MPAKKPTKTAKTLTGARGRVAAAKARKAAAATRAAAQAAVKAAAATKALDKPAKVINPSIKSDGTPKYRGIWAEAAEAAAKGKLPPAPDFTAETHKPYRAKLATLVELAKAGDIAGMRAVAINPISSSPKALARYRDLAVMAILQAKVGA